MAPTLYSFFASPPCRAVLLTAKAVGVEFNVKTVDITKGETKDKDFLKINPQHTIPFVDDDGFYISESRAIQQYLADKYGKNDSLYPKDLKVRATVNSRLQFDATTFYTRVGITYLAPAFRGTKFAPENIALVDDALSILDSLIGEGNNFLVNNQLTIADITTVVTLSTAEAVGHDFSKYKNVSRWYANIKKVVPGYEELNQKGATFLGETYKKIMASK